MTRERDHTGGPINRRKFLVTAAAGGFALGFRLPAEGRAAGRDVSNPGLQTRVPDDAPVEDLPFNAWVRISTDDTVTVLLSQSEMGQGVYTSFPMLVADELGADWNRIRVEAAPVDRVYVNTLNERAFLGVPITDPPEGALDTLWDWVAGGIATRLSRQYTGGSTSIRFWAGPLREAGAAVREMLVTAAATAWRVPVEDCIVDNGVVLHPPSARARTFGDLAGAATKLDPPEHPKLKGRDQLSLVGKPVPRLDIPMKVDGSAGFGIDVRLPDMLHGVPRTCPVFGGRVKNYDADAIADMPGFIALVDVPNGVVVVADSTWRAAKAAGALPIRFDEGKHAGASNAQILDRLRAAGRDQKGVVDRADGDVEAAFAESAKVIDAEYTVPFLAHACLEPINCTARVTADACELWIPTQAQESVQIAAADAAGVSKNDVVVNTTFLGGGFGRRGETDMVTQAVLAAKAVGRPVKVTWTREEDIRHDFYRPAAHGRLRASLDENGDVTGWRHRIVSPSILKRTVPYITYLGHDVTSVEGAANLPYRIPNQLVEYVMEDTPVPIGFWRSVGSSQNAFITESFIDELAHAGGRDPYAFRRILLADTPRFRTVLDLAAEKSGWGSDLPDGWGRGIAIHKCFGSIVAQVADVRVATDGGLKVERVVCAIDCGQVVNPDTVIAQMEGGILFGLTAALYGEMTIDKGRVVEGNFDSYQMVRLADAPKIETYIIDGGLPMGGVGEPGTPPVAPAVTNAIFTATGKRIRDLPIRNHDMST